MYTDKSNQHDLSYQSMWMMGHGFSGLWFQRHHMAMVTNSLSTVAPPPIHQHARTDHDSMTYHTTTTSVLTMATSIEAMLPVIYREMVM